MTIESVILACIAGFDVSSTYFVQRSPDAAASSCQRASWQRKSLRAQPTDSIVHRVVLEHLARDL